MSGNYFALVALTTVVLFKVLVTINAAPSETCQATIGDSKNGSCPQLGQFCAINCFRCVDSCTSDAECPGKHKCCRLQMGCGNACTNSALFSCN
ncbi:Anosmin-1 [Orchesella cincta]|uniref:Anosmin-1 n=1 Tax=Orchesella cincta TaxID=48709 RepID=A0A1D2MIV6_ORCCI|nr:Anosmin-1 [Orchesella cincta]